MRTIAEAPSNAIQIIVKTASSSTQKRATPAERVTMFSRISRTSTAVSAVMTFFSRLSTPLENREIQRD